MEEQVLIENCDVESLLTPSADAVAGIVERHGADLLRVARRYSSTVADADDAYQRAFETLLTKAPSIDERRLLGWLLVVVRNEALQIARGCRIGPQPSLDEIEGVPAAGGVSPEDTLLESERLGCKKEALRRIKPDQLRCLVLLADGRSYDEIAEITGLPYTRVNRYLSEGRKALRARLRMIDAGYECERLAPVLSQMADQMADQVAVADAKLHLANCRHCRATLRAYAEIPRKIAAALPLGAAAGQRDGIVGQLSDYFGSLMTSLQERAFGHAVAATPGTEAAFAKKAIALTAAAATLASGGAAISTVTGPADSDRTPVPTRPLQEVKSTPPPPLAVRDRTAAVDGPAGVSRGTVEDEVVDPDFGESVSSPGRRQVREPVPQETEPAPVAVDLGPADPTLEAPAGQVDAGSETFAPDPVADPQP